MGEKTALRVEAHGRKRKARRGSVGERGVHGDEEGRRGGDEAAGLEGAAKRCGEDGRAHAGSCVILLGGQG